LVLAKKAFVLFLKKKKEERMNKQTKKSKALHKEVH